MIIKVCGMRDPRNIEQVASLGVNWLGFIFYPQSPRYIHSSLLCASLSDLPLFILHSSFQKVGVFVNATFEQMLETVDAYKLDYLQLHGNESPELCFALQKRGIKQIKAISVSSVEDLKQTQDYEGYIDYFLFDTKCENYGGSGKQFDWSILSAYKGKTPFLLSGGLNPDSVESIRNFSHPRFAGIDLNSGFEIEPALKDIEKLATFLSELNIHN